MDRHPSAALGTGKLVRPDGTLDSAGIRLPRHRRPRDRGSGKPDRGQYDRSEFVFGASGAAMILRCAAVEALRIDGELFDEDFFVYHEDTDLSWRCHNLGWDVLYAPAARAVHGRRWRPHRRFQMPVEVRRHSFKNHYLQLVKNERGRDLLVNLPALLVWEVLRFGFALLRDPSVLPAYDQAAQLVVGAWRKRRLIAARRPRPRSSCARAASTHASPRIATAGETADTERDRQGPGAGAR
jgi:GT2 family glycosyltransferase